MRTTRLSWPAGLLLLCFASIPAAAAPPASETKGVIRGKALDAETKEPLPFANVMFRRVGRDLAGDGEAAGGAMTGEDGTFFRRVAPGGYHVVFSYISYEQKTIRGIFVAPGDTVTVDGLLESGSIEVETVVVEAEIVRDAEGSMLRKQQQAAAATDAITTDQMSKTTDSNAADALQRVTGVTVIGGKYVYVRGLGERYSQTQLNGATLGSPEPNKKVIPLDIFPTEVLDNITVQKTYTPDMDGEFAGSVITLNTKEYAKNLFRQSLSLGRTEATTGGGSISYHGGSLDFLGFDDGTRALPDIVKEMAGSKRVVRDFFTDAERAEMGKAFQNVWTPQSVNTTPDFSYSGLVSREMRPLGKETGLLATFSLSHSTESLERQDNVYTGAAEPSPIHEYNVQETQASVLWGLNVGATSQLAEDDKLKLNLLYTRHADDVSRYSSGENFDRGSQVRISQLSYVERGLFSGVLQGSHGIGLLGSTLDWNGAYSRASRAEPDRRQSVYELQGESYALNGAGSDPLTRVFGESAENSWAAKFDWTIPFRFRSRSSNLKSGLAYGAKERETEYRRFRFSDLGSVHNRHALAESLATQENIEEGIYKLEELTRPSDTYAADQHVRAAYLMADVPVFSRLRAVVGGRYEDAKQSVDAKSPFAIEDEGTKVKKHFQTFLPSVNLTWTPGKNMNLRAAYARSLNRPELREISPFTNDNYETNYEVSGDTSLVQARIENYDLRWELYPGPGQLLAFGVFYKEFDQPIVKYVFPNVTGYAERPVNGVEDKDGSKGHLSGWEGEVRLSFHDFWKGMDWAADLGRAPRFLADWSISANYSRVQSETHVVNAAHRVVTVPLAGQSEYSANVGLYYGHSHWESALLYRSFGPRLAYFGFGDLKDIIEHPPESLDFTLSYRLTRATKVRFSAENLLNDRLEFKQGDLVTQSYRTGTSIGISVTYQADGGGE